MEMSNKGYETNQSTYDLESIGLSQDLRNTGEFEFETPDSESRNLGKSRIYSKLVRYRGTKLNLDLSIMKISRSAMEFEVLKDSHYLDHKDDILFQIGFINKQIKDTYKSSIEHSIMVTAKYCERQEICLVLESNMKPILIRKIESDSYKPFFRELLSFQIEKQSLVIYYQTARQMCKVLVCLTAPDLENYDFAVALAHPSSAISLTARDGHVMASNNNNEEPQTLRNESTSADFDFDLEYRGSSIDYSINDAMQFSRSIVEFQIFADVQPPNTSAKFEKQILEVGLVPKGFIDNETVFRYSKESVAVQLTLESSNTSERKWHIYSWKNGNLSKNITVAKLYFNPLRFHFVIDTKSKIVRILMLDNIECTCMCMNLYDFEILENVEFNGALYPCVGIETTSFPIKIFYKVKYVYI